MVRPRRLELLPSDPYAELLEGGNSNYAAMYEGSVPAIWLVW